MLKGTKKVSNPLTIIAIFAGLTELSATAILPFVSEANQSIVLVFLLGFPTMLVVLFFLTLNFNNKVLYAPSDFSDENNFIAMMNRQLNEAEQRITQNFEKELNEKVSALEDNLSQNEALNQIRDLIHNDQYDEALAQVDGLLGVRISGEALHLKAMILSRGLDYKKAIDLCTQGLELGNNNSAITASLYWNRACYKCQNQNDVDSILEDLEEAILHNLELSEKLLSEDDLAPIRNDPGFKDFEKRFCDRA